MPAQSTTTNVTAASIMDKVASLMNDTAKTVYTYAAQLPYLQIALDELQEHMESINMSVTNSVSTDINIPADTEVVNPSVGFGVNTAPNYPADLVNVLNIYERSAGSSEPFIPVAFKEFLPTSLVGISSNQLNYWTWQDQRIKFLPCNTDREIRIEYIKSVFPKELSETSEIGIINGKVFLQFRTAALCSEFVGENPTRANSLNQMAVMALDRISGIDVKGRQNQNTRRQPFMSRFKNRWN